nr:repetitive proline-rich cell wall protein [Tanacetum cinerariifolium]
SKALITIDTLVDWTNHDSESDRVIAAKEFGMIAGCDSKDAIKEDAAKIYNLITEANSEEANTIGDAREFALMGVTSEVHNCPFGYDNKYNELKKQYNEFNKQNNEYFIQVQAYKNSVKTLEKQKRVLQRNQLTLKEKIRVLSIELENISNLLKHSEIINADVETAKKDLQTKLNNHLVQTEKWRNSSKNLFRLIDRWDDFAFSVFTTNSEDVKGRPMFHRFAKTDSMKAVPPPLTGDYTSLSDRTDLDESQMSYGTKSSTSCDPKYVPNDFVSRNDSYKSSKVYTNDFAFSNSSVKSSEHKPTDSTSCASTSSVSTSVNEAEIESNFVLQAILLRTGKVHIPPVRPQPVPTSKPKVTPVPTGKPKVKPVPTGKPNFTPVPTGKPKVTPVPTGKPKVTSVPTGKPRVSTPVPTAILLRTGKVHIPPVRPQPVPTSKPKVTPIPTGKPKVKPVPTGKPNVTPVPTGKPKVTPVPIGKPKVTSVPTGKPWVSTPVPTGRPNRPFLVHSDRGYFPSENPFLATEDERIFDSGCSRSMTGNKERLDDFQAFHSGKHLELIYDKKNQVLFTDTEFLVLSKDFKLPDDSMVVLK